MPAFEGDCECVSEYFLSLLPGVVTTIYIVLSHIYLMQDNTSLLKLNVDHNSRGDGWGPTLTAMAQVIDSIRKRD